MDVRTDRLGQRVITGRVKSPLQDFALDHESAWHAALAGALVGRLVGKVDARVLVISGIAISAWSLWYMTGFDLQMDGAPIMISGFFQGIPISTSASRTVVAEASGAKTQLTAVVGALAVVLLLLFGADLLANLPHAALAGVVIASAIGLFEFSDLRRVYRIQRWEFWLSMTCFAGVAVFGAIQGIAIAVGIAVLEFLWDGWRPHSAILGRAPTLSLVSWGGNR